jgi:hypothetical protein
MSNFHDYPSNVWKHKEWKTSNQTHLIPRSPTPTASLQSTSTSTVSAAAIVSRASATCLQNCRDTFRDSILPYDKDFDKICAILADENNDAVFSALYGCDEGCGVVINGTGQVGQDREFR